MVNKIIISKITINATRNYHTVNIKYVDNNDELIAPDKFYIFNDAAEFHLPQQEYAKDIPEYDLIYIANNMDNYILENDIVIVCHYIEKNSYQRGDVNNDGIVNKEDVIELAKYIVNKTSDLSNSNLYLGDMDNDGLIKMNDITILLKSIHDNL